MASIPHIVSSRFNSRDPRTPRPWELAGTAIDVREMGAVGDNTADDTAALQAALSSVGGNGGIVILPAGLRCRFTATLTIKSHTRLTGGGTLVGAGSTPFHGIQNANWAASSKTDADIEIDGITVDFSAFLVGAGAHIVRLRMCRRVRVRNSRLIGGSSSVALQACANTLIENNSLEEFRNCGADHWESPADARVLGNDLSTSVSAQMVNFNPEDTDGVVTGRVAEGFVMADNTLVSAEASATPCQIEPLATGNAVRDVSIGNNRFRNVHVVLRGDVAGASITGNTFSNFQGDVEPVAAYGRFGSFPAGFVVQGNTIRDPLTESPNLGVIRVHSDGAVISGNTIYGTAYAAAAIYVGSTAAQIGLNFIQKEAARIPGHLQDGLGSIPARVAAAGTTIGTATALTAQNTEVTSATAGVADGVLLRNQVGFRQTVTNSSAATLKVYPRNVAGSTIDGGAALAAVTIAAGKSKTFDHYSAGNYRTVAAT